MNTWTHFPVRSRVGLLSLAGLVAAHALLVSAINAADWSQWRGPDRSNLSLETGLLQEWPKSGPPLAWELSGLGMGIHPVSVAAGRVYVVGNRDGAEYAFALEASDGTKIWATRLGATIQENSLMRWLSQRSPTVDKDQIYVFTSKGDLFCLDREDGRKVWRRSYAEEFQARRHWGFCDYPLIDGDRLICTPFATNATVAALNKHTGETVWQTAVEGAGMAGYGAMVVSLAGGVRQYVVLVREHLVGIAADDGRVLWRQERPRTRTGGTYTPIVRGAQIFSPNGYGGGIVLYTLIREGERFMARQEYHNDYPLDAFEDSTVRVGDYVYAFGKAGAPACIELASGRVLWEQPTSQGHGRAALTYADGRLYMRHSNGIITMAEVTPDAYVEKGRFTIPRYTRASGVTFPVVAQGRLWLRDDNMLYCYDIRAGGDENRHSEPVSKLLTLSEAELSPDDTDAAVPRTGRDRPPDAIYIPTPHEVVAQMLELAGVAKEDVVYDLGSGDGRIVLAAAKTYGARAVGFEIDPNLVRVSRRKIAEAGLGDRARIEHEDVFTRDLSGADVVTVFLYPNLMERLKPQLMKLKPGARIVSHQFEFPGIAPDKEITVESQEDGEPHRVFLWTAPLKSDKK